MSELIYALSLAWSVTLPTSSPAVQPAKPSRPNPVQVASGAATTSAPAAAPKPATPAVDAKRHSILFFTASWCPACLQMKSQTLPYVSLPGHDLKVIDVDQNPQLGQSYGVQSLPAYVVLDGLGRAYKHGVGFRDVRQFVDFLNGR
jgi:thiol-disulfide isomerase/thioredoxin